jgi:hypothetical protein
MIFLVFSAIFFKPFLRSKIDPMPLKVNYSKAKILLIRICRFLSNLFLKAPAELCHVFYREPLQSNAVKR